MDKQKILIVEDNSDIRRGLSVLLNAHNYDTVMATDVMSATGIVLRERPNLILLDLGLPSGDESLIPSADGFLVMESLRAVTVPPIPVIILSGRDAATYEERARKLGATHFLQKPVDNDKLLAAIESSLREGETPESAARSGQDGAISTRSGDGRYERHTEFASGLLAEGPQRDRVPASNS